MYRMVGYFRPGSKLGGSTTSPWMGSSIGALELQVMHCADFQLRDEGIGVFGDLAQVLALEGVDLCGRGVVRREDGGVAGCGDSGPTQRRDPGSAF